TISWKIHPGRECLRRDKRRACSEASPLPETSVRLSRHETPVSQAERPAKGCARPLPCSPAVLVPYGFLCWTSAAVGLTSAKGSAGRSAGEVGAPPRGAVHCWMSSGRPYKALAELDVAEQAAPLHFEQQSIARVDLLQ